MPPHYALKSLHKFRIFIGTGYFHNSILQNIVEEDRAWSRSFHVYCSQNLKNHKILQYYFLTNFRRKNFFWLMKFNIKF